MPKLKKFPVYCCIYLGIFVGVDSYLDMELVSASNWALADEFIPH